MKEENTLLKQEKETLNHRIVEQAKEMTETMERKLVEETKQLDDDFNIRRMRFKKLNCIVTSMGHLREPGRERHGT